MMMYWNRKVSLSEYQLCSVLFMEMHEFGFKLSMMRLLFQLLLTGEVFINVVDGLGES